MSAQANSVQDEAFDPARVKQGNDLFETPYAGFWQALTIIRESLVTLEQHATQVLASFGNSLRELAANLANDTIKNVLQRDLNNIKNDINNGGDPQKVSAEVSRDTSELNVHQTAFSQAQTLVSALASQTDTTVGQESDGINQGYDNLKSLIGLFQILLR